MANDRFQKLRMSQVLAKLARMHEAHLRTGRVQYWHAWSYKVKFGASGYAYQSNWSDNWIETDPAHIACLMDDLQNRRITVPSVRYMWNNFFPVQEIGEA
jgi:hypothetical protein